MANRFEALSKRRQLALLFGSFLAFVLVLALLAEGALRVRQALRDGSLAHGDIENLVRIDPATGLRVPIAGLHTPRLSINSLGFRGPEIPVVKPPGTYRVAFIGASTTFCAEVSSDAMAWPSLVVDRLRAAMPDRRFDFINAGVPGYTLGSMQRNLESYVAPLKPDLVVIYEGTNDLTIQAVAEARREGIPFDAGDSGLSWLSRYSLLAYLVEKNAVILRRQWMAAGDTAKLNVPSERLAKPYEDSLDALVKSARSIAGRVVLVTFSSRIRAEQTPEEKAQAAVTALYYMPFRTPDDLVRDYAAINDAMRRVGQRENVGVIEVGNAIPGDKQHFTDSVHFNDAGSLMMADLVAAGLLRQVGSETIGGR